MKNDWDETVRDIENRLDTLDQNINLVATSINGDPDIQDDPEGESDE